MADLHELDAWKAFAASATNQLSRIDNVRTRKYSVRVYKDEAMHATGSKEGVARSETINLRATRRQKALIDRAAEALGRSRSDFMLETACREAETVLLDRRYFSLSEEAFRRFTAMLDKPPASNPRLRRRLQTKAPWDR